MIYSDTAALLESVDAIVNGVLWRSTIDLAFVAIVSMAVLIMTIKVSRRRVHRKFKWRTKML